MSEISDEFKTIVVEAIRSVCVKFPRKHHILMTFLSSMLREEGGFEYKRAIVCTIITIIEENPDAKESGFFPSSPPPYPSSYIHTHTHTLFPSLSLSLSLSSHSLTLLMRGLSTSLPSSRGQLAKHLATQLFLLALGGKTLIFSQEF